MDNKVALKLFPTNRAKWLLMIHYILFNDVDIVRLANRHMEFEVELWQEIQNRVNPYVYAPVY